MESLKETQIVNYQNYDEMMIISTWLTWSKIFNRSNGATAVRDLQQSGSKLIQTEEIKLYQSIAKNIPIIAQKKSENEHQR